MVNSIFVISEYPKSMGKKHYSLQSPYKLMVSCETMDYVVNHQYKHFHGSGS